MGLEDYSFFRFFHRLTSGGSSSTHLFGDFFPNGFVFTFLPSRAIIVHNIKLLRCLINLASINQVEPFINA
jgi:hypothetical protein